MYRVILVDDEHWTLQGIKETFDWGKYGMEVIGSYVYATEAKKEILDKKPDVVFTDIKMPVISGLELLNVIRENGLDTEVVIISGYGQFEYAREAIKNEAFDYCLKPIDKDETEQLLERLKTRLDMKIQAKKDRLVEMLIEDLEDFNAVQYGLPKEYPLYQVALWKGNDSSFRHFLKEREDVEFIHFDVLGKKYYIINCTDNISEHIRQEFLEELMGLSRVYGSVASLRKMITEASIAASEYFITNTKAVYLYKPAQLNKITPFIQRITKLLDEGQLMEFEQLIKQISQLFRENQYGIEDLCTLWNRIIMHIEILYPDKVQKSELTTMEWEQLTIEFDNIDYLCRMLLKEVRYVFGTSSLDGKYSEKEDSSNFSKILHYLNQHYTEQIKLKDISKIHYLNKNYACYLFKRNTGMTYSDYLNKIRMEQAKKLLLSTEYTIFEISEMTGYIDYSYFSKVFKKRYGITPSQYRKNPLETISSEEKLEKND